MSDISTPRTPRQTPRLRCELLTDFAQLETLEPEWERLRRAERRHDVFMSFAWARASWRATGHRRRLCTPVVFGGEQVLGLLPLAAEGETLRFIGSPFSDCNDLLAEDGHAAAVLELALDALTSSGGPWTRCLLENVPEGSNLVEARQALPPRLSSRLLLESTTPCPTLALGEDRVPKLKALLAKGHLKNIEKRLSRKGDISFRHVERADEIRACLPDLYRQHRNRWAVAGQPSLFDRPEARDFYDALVDELDPRRELRFGVLESGGRPVAYHFGFQSDERFLFYKPTFDIEFWDDSPGQILLKRLFEYLLHTHVREFDFLLGGEGYKTRFADGVAPSHSYVFFRSRPRARAAGLLARAKERLKKSPRLFSLTKTGVERAAAGARTVRGAYRRFGLLRSAAKAGRKLFRSGIYARDEVCVYFLDAGRDGVAESAPNTDSAPNTGLDADGIEIRPGTLTDLAELARKYPQDVGPGQLQHARDRFKRGDRVFVALSHGEIVHTVWLGMRHEITASEAGPHCRIPLDRPEAVIGDAWTPPPFRNRGVYRRVLRRLGGDALQTHGRVWVYCLSGNAASRRGIEAAGFRPWGRMSRTRWFRAFEKGRVSHACE